MTDLRALQARFDAEARTIEAGRRAFIPERPTGEPSMLAGVGAVLTIFALLPFAYLILEALTS